MKCFEGLLEEYGMDRNEMKCCIYNDMEHGFSVNSNSMYYTERGG